MNVLWWQRLVCERSFYCVKIMRSDSHECPLSRQILMELVLKRNEGVISLFGEFNISQYSPRYERPYPRCLQASVTSLSSGIAPRRRPTSLVAVMLCSSPFGGGFSLYSGDNCFPRKMLSIKEMPSKHSISYLPIYHQPMAH